MNFKKIKGEAWRSEGGETRGQNEFEKTDIILRHGWGPRRMVYFKSLDNTLSLDGT